MLAALLLSSAALHGTASFALEPGLEFPPDSLRTGNGLKPPGHYQYGLEQRTDDNIDDEDAATEDDVSAADELVRYGLDYLGVRYRRGGTSRETGLDCSGLVQNVFRKALGLSLPRTARDMSRLGTQIGKQDLQPGDLVFFNTMRRQFSHVGIYVGNNQFLHAPSSGGKVRIDNMTQKYWTARFNGARRLVDGDTVAALSVTR